MKLSKRDVLITSCNLGQTKEGKAYLSIGFLDLEDGNNYNISSQNLELMQQLQPMTKYKCNFLLSSTKYGLKLSLEQVGEKLGNI